MQEDTSFRGDVIGLCISIKGKAYGRRGKAPTRLIFAEALLLLLHCCVVARIKSTTILVKDP